MPNPFFPPSPTVGEAWAVIVEGGMLLAFVAAWTALYIAVCPLEAYASELTPWNRQALSETAGIVALGWIVVIVFLACAWARYRNKTDPHRADDEPFAKPTDYGDYPHLGSWSERK